MRFGNLLAFLIAALALALGLAKAAEIILKVQPCKLCYYQRYIYSTTILLCSLFFLGSARFAKILIIILLLVASSGLSIYHLGVERGWFAYNSECTTTFAKAETFLEYKKMLKQKEIVPCDQPLIEPLGLSVSGWNFIYSFALLIITVLVSAKSNWFLNEQAEPSAFAKERSYRGDN